MRLSSIETEDHLGCDGAAALRQSNWLIQVAPHGLMKIMSGFQDRGRNTLSPVFHLHPSDLPTTLGIKNTDLKLA